MATSGHFAGANYPLSCFEPFFNILWFGIVVRYGYCIFVRVLQFFRVQYFALPSNIYVYNFVDIPYNKFWEALYFVIAVKSIIDMILDKTYQRLHFMSIFIIMQKYEDSPPTDKLQTLSSVMLTVQTHSFSPV